MILPSKHGPPALFFTDEGEGHFRCKLCPHHCRMKEGQNGLCRVRGVREGTPRALCYGVISAAHVDPLEKKPLYHFFPGETVYSVGGWSCNLACFFCQNWLISQDRPAEADRVTPTQIIHAVQANRCRHLAFTYNEPLIGYEFVLDTAKLARAAGVSTILVTNGFVEAEPADGLLPWIDALNIDIKSMEDEFYRNHCRGTLAPILKFCRQAVGQGCHVEITNLVIPTLNDRPELIRQLSHWISSELGHQVPLHLSAYHPDYKCKLPPTTAAILTEAVRVAREELQFVYAGNLVESTDQDTLCPQCGTVWIRRRGYQVEQVGLAGVECSGCHHPFEGRIGEKK